MFLSREKHSIKLAKSAGNFLCATAVVIALAGFNAAFFAAPARAAVGTDPQLVKLEMKFFQHDYSKEDVQTRLGRLEKMVFGDAKTGDPQTRLQSLMSAVPNLDAPSPSAAPAPEQPTASAPPPPRRSSAPARSTRNDNDDATDTVSREQQITGSSAYPQVSAMEKKLFERDFATEPLAKRLSRLETTLFGKPSDSNDLSERVDRLKAKTGVDLAAAPPPGTDWADDDDDAPHGGGDITYVPAETTPFTSAGSGSLHPRGNSSGSYGTHGGSPYADDNMNSTGNYGFHPSGAGSIPATAGGGMPPLAPSTGSNPGGLNQQVAVLENQVFKKTFPNDPLPARINRLESTVFSGKATTTNMSLPERVGRLTDVLGSAPQPVQAAHKRVAQKHSDDDDLDDPQMPPTAPPRSGLSKIIGGLGNLITGGNGSAYPMGSNLVTDPRTGMLVDMYSGNIIDPRTGSVVGNQATGISPNTFGALPFSGGGLGTGFNSGLSPMGSGMHFGTGFGRMGGMGIGTGIGGMGTGLGVWP
jgi:hypothetical protein